MRKLSKNDVEVLLQSYDADPTGSLLRAISIALESNFSNWQRAVEQLPSDAYNISALLQEETDHLDSLVKQLVEHRTL